jgi:hypothetical protein
MRLGFALASALIILAGVLPGPARGQSLADVARQEAERRKEVEQPTKTFTNRDLPNAPAPSSTPAPSEPSSAKPAGAAASGGKSDEGKTAGKETGSDKSKDQKYWADRQKALHDKLQEDKVIADALQSRINALTTDFVNRDDPAQRAVIGSDRQKAIDELASVKDAIVADTKAIADFEEDARKAGVPAGWLR